MAAAIPFPHTSANAPGPSDSETYGPNQPARQDSCGRMSRLLIVIVFAIPLASQTLEIHSEFLRVDPWGRILSSDATPDPKEILSPAVVRNGFASFHIVVRSSRMNYFLFVGTNPPDVIRTALYKEEFVERGGTWFPDALKPARLPDFGVIPDPEASIPGRLRDPTCWTSGCRLRPLRGSCGSKCS